MSEGTQRRLAAIVAADVAGYSRLVGMDEEGTLAAYRAYRRDLIDPTIASHNGRIANTAGDSLLLEFTSVVDAVRCAIAIQSGLTDRNADISDEKQILMRVGINVGDVVADGNDLLGDGVNIAARLEGLADAGGIALSDDAYRQVRDRLDISWQDDGEHEFKNIARPVHVWRWMPGTVSHAAPRADEPNLSLPNKPSIAVLPFENLSGDAEQEFFADGMTEDVITELSRFDDLFVIARNSSFAYKGQHIDVKTVAEQLGVRFILEGSVRKAGQRVRISAQLINGQDGGHIWAERYDGGLEDVFDLQEQVTSQVVGSIAPKITEAELEQVGRGKRIFDEAHENAWRAGDIYRKGLRLGDAQMVESAIEMAIEAAKSNPKCSVAYQVICTGYAMKSLRSWGGDPTELARIGERWARTFLSELPNSYMAYFSLGQALQRKGEHAAAKREYRHAKELNPNASVIYQWWAFSEACTGDLESAKEHAYLAIRLSPKDIQIGNAYLALAMVAFIEDDHAGLEEWADKAIQLAPSSPMRRALLISHAGWTGNRPLLETHSAELMRFAPNFIGSVFRGENWFFKQPAHAEKLLDGLRKAGFSE